MFRASVKFLIAESDADIVIQIRNCLSKVKIPHHIDWIKTADELIRHLRIIQPDVILISQKIIAQARETHWCNATYSAADTIWIALVQDINAWAPPPKCPVVFEDFVMTPSDLNGHLPFRITQLLQRVQSRKRHTRHLASFKSAIDHLTHPVCICSENFKPVYANHCWQSLSGETKRSILNQFESDHVRPDQTAIVRTPESNNISINRDIVVSHIKWDSKNAWFLLRVPHNEHVSDQEIKSAFYSNVRSHLMQPVEQLMAFFNNQKLEDKKHPDEIKKAYAIISQLHSKLSAIAEFSQIADGSLPLKKEKFDLLPLLEEIARSCSDQSSDPDVLFQAQLPDVIQPILGDREHIRSIIEHLIGNAFKHAKKGCIELRVLPGKEHVACSVFNPGAGISPDILKTIFEPFQPPRSEAQYDQTELPFIKMLTKAHGGEIWAESEPGQGCRFTFTLPYYNKKTVLENELAQAQKAVQPDSGSFTLFTLQMDPFDNRELGVKISETLQSSFQCARFFLQHEVSKYYIIGEHEITKPGLQIFKRRLKHLLIEQNQENLLNFTYKILTYPADVQHAEQMAELIDENLSHEMHILHEREILIVDDEEAAIDTLNRMLRQAGYRHVRTALNGLQALQRIEKKIPDLIILDMRMPEMSGYEMMGRLKENHQYRSIPVLIMSGFPIKPEFLQDTDCVSDIATLNKPVTKDELLHKVYYLL